MEDFTPTITPEYQQCLDHIDNRTNVIYVSGEAGTGKSVLIDHISQEYNHMNVVKVAPTGVAALNIGGQTIHSFFRLPLGLLHEKKINNHIDRMKQYNVGVFLSLEVLIIDEISMVRADILDAIDQILRKLRGIEHVPFGGVVVLIFGDLYQLPPVLKDDERDMFLSRYDSEYFFSSNVFKKLLKRSTSFAFIELTQIFRQTDPVFKNILSLLRLNNEVSDCLTILNHKCLSSVDDYVASDDIMLCTTNSAADYINNSELDKLEGELFTYTAKVSGDFNIKIPTPELLQLKVGSKVMFTRNGDYWVNGSLAIVKELSESSIKVTLTDDNVDVVVSKEIWENVKYKHNTKEDRIDENVAGTFSQYPLMLAWSATVHKVQGLTFDSVAIDLGREAFAHGQTYVALSRCRSLEGIKLMRSIKHMDIKVDRRVRNFYDNVLRHYSDGEEPLLQYS